MLYVMCRSACSSASGDASRDVIPTRSPDGLPLDVGAAEPSRRCCRGVGVTTGTPVLQRQIRIRESLSFNG